MTLKNFENLGIGIDIVKVDQFRQKEYSENIDFYQKIFSSNEIKYCMKFNDPYPHFAGKFALKEALIKSINENIKLIDIKTDHSFSKPVIELKKSSYNFTASISNERDIAVGVVLSFKI